MSDGESHTNQTETGEASPFDRLTSLAATLFEAPAALVSITDGHRLRFRSRLGIDVAEVDRETAFTPHAVALGQGGVLVVEDASLDPRFENSPHVTGEGHVRFYAGAVITMGDGRNVGALCVLDKRARPRPDEAKLTALRSMAQLAADMLEKRAQAQAKAEKLEMLDMAEAMSGVGHWRLDVATNRATWSDQVYHVHGVDPGSFDPNLGSAIDAYHPEDRATIEAAVRRAVEDGEPYDVRLRLIRTDGATRLVRSQGTPQHDESGRVTAVFGVFQDITEQTESSGAGPQEREPLSPAGRQHQRRHHPGEGGRQQQLHLAGGGAGDRLEPDGDGREEGPGLPAGGRPADLPERPGRGAGDRRAAPGAVPRPAPERRHPLGREQHAAGAEQPGRA